MRVYRLRNKGGTESWVAAPDEAGAIAHFVRIGRAKEPENVVSVRDQTDVLLASNKDCNLDQLLTSLPAPALLSIRMGPLPNMNDVLVGKPVPNVSREWVAH